MVTGSKTSFFFSFFFLREKKDPEGKESHRKIGPLMNEENREINDDLKRLSY